METIKITVTGAQAQMENAPVLTCGMVGVPVELTFDAAWDGLQKTLVYKAGGLIRDQVGVEDAGTVPGEMLQIPYRSLQIGVYGASADGAIVIPTVWANAGQIREGANPSGDTSTQPALPVWQQILNRITALEAPKEPQLLWEFAMPAGEMYSWDDGQTFCFCDSNGQDRPWNDGWATDPTLPANTTLRKKFEEMFALAVSGKNIWLECIIPGAATQSGTPSVAMQRYEETTGYKLILVAGDTLTMSTPVGLYVMEISGEGIYFNYSIGDAAAYYGWIIRLYG